MVDFDTQLLNVVFFLAAAQKKELCFNPEDGMIYEVKARSKADCTLLPIGGSNTPIFDFNPEKLIFRNDISTRSQNIAIRTFKNAINTQSERTTLHSENANNTFEERENCISTTKTNTVEPNLKREVIGVGKVDLPKFSMLYTGETAKWSAQIELLLDKIFSATNYPKTIEKTIENYNAAKKFAQNGQIYELKQLTDRLQGRINKQNAMQTAMNTMQAQQQARRKMLFSAVAAIIIVVCYFVVCHFCREIPYTQSQTEILAFAELDSKINAMAKENDVKIYPYRRDKIKKEIQLSGDNSLQNIELIIKNNINDLKYSKR